MEKIYMKAVLGKKSYYGYKIDIILGGIAILIFSYFITIIFSNSVFLSIIVSLQIVTILLNINKIVNINIIKKGKKIYDENETKKFFESKIFNASKKDYNRFMTILLNYLRYYKCESVGKNKYCAYKNDKMVYFTVLRFYKGAFVDKRDIRDFIDYATRNKEKNILIIFNKIDDDAIEYFESFKLKMDISLLTLEDIFKIVYECELMTVDSICVENNFKIRNRKKIFTHIFNNFTFDNKMFLYLLSSILFNILYFLTRKNKLFIFISIYFICISIFSAIINMYKKAKQVIKKL